MSLLERDRRRVNDSESLRRIADLLGIPHHLLGVVDKEDQDFVAMLKFADSTIRLAEVARQLGRAADSVAELWPLVARLEARLASGPVDREIAIVLAQARTALGTALGHALPEERLGWAAHWTAKAVRLARKLDNSELQSHTLRMHGNELRKTGRAQSAIACLQQAVQLAATRSDRGSTYLLLARAAGDQENRDLFDRALSAARLALDDGVEQSMLLNSFSLREVQLRGLTSTGRVREAARHVRRSDPGDTTVAPQWLVIERVTSAQALIDSGGDREQAINALQEAIAAARRHKLPQQVQRALRIASRIPGGDSTERVRQSALEALNGLKNAVAGPYAPPKR